MDTTSAGPVVLAACNSDEQNIYRDTDTHSTGHCQQAVVTCPTELLYFRRAHFYKYVQSILLVY
jgi:hypothetical protein